MICMYTRGEVGKEQCWQIDRTCSIQKAKVREQSVSKVGRLEPPRPWISESNKERNKSYVNDIYFSKKLPY